MLLFAEELTTVDHLESCTATSLKAEEMTWYIQMRSLIFGDR